MTLFPPFVVRFSTRINAIKHSDNEVAEIVSLIEKYMITNYGKNIMVENNLLYFDYLPTYTIKGPIVTVEKGVFGVSFDNNAVIVKYTFSMLKSILASIGVFLVVGIFILITDKTFEVWLVYTCPIFIGFFWLISIIRERLVLGVIRRKVIEYLGSQVRLLH